MDDEVNNEPELCKSDRINHKPRHEPLPLSKPQTWAKETPVRGPNLVPRYLGT